MTPVPFHDTPLTTLPDTLRALIPTLAAMPFSTAEMSAAATGRAQRTIRDHLGTLVDGGSVHTAQMGNAACRWLSSATFSRFNLAAHYYNGRRGMGILAARISAVDSIYRMAIALDLIKPGATFQWYTRRPYDAVAGSHDDWTALFWIGIWDDRNAIHRRITRLGAEVGASWPYVLAFAVPDHWQAALVENVLYDLHLTGHSAIYVAADRSWHLPCPAPPQRPGAGWPEPPRLYLPPGPSTDQELAQLLDEQHYTGRTGPIIQAILPVLEQWHGIRPSHIRSLLRNRISGSDIINTLGIMVEQKLSVQENGVYHPGPAAVTRAAHRDRVHKEHVESRIGSTLTNATLRRNRRHDWAALRIVLDFLKQGCHIAPGWRAVQDYGKAGKIDPDAMIYLHASPYGPGWHFLEYERRAQTADAIWEKFRGYRSPQRFDNLPVMFVVTDPDVERLYWEQGRGIKLITAAQSRSGPLQWHSFGTPLYLYPKTGREVLRLPRPL